jgi:hypothetical protein
MYRFSFHLLLYACLFSFSSIFAQVQVSQEPNHRPVLENKFIRVLDVWLQPGDTTEFHIHSTPSLFLHLTTTDIATQTQGEEWVFDKNIAGKALYRSFSPDILIHRVTNRDTTLFHVTDMELLSAFDSDPNTRKLPLPFPVIIENENAIAYRLTIQDMQIATKSRGPMIAQLVSGSDVVYNNLKTKEYMIMSPGQFVYIDPGTSFNFSSEGVGEIDLVVFEVK